MTTTTPETLFTNHYRTAVTLARREGAPDPENTAADVLAAVLRLILAGHEIEHPAGYIATAIRHRAHRDSTLARRCQPLETLMREPATNPHQWPDEHLTAAFQTLMPRWQQILTLTLIDGRKPADVAQQLGLAPNAVSALAYRARRELRAAYLTLIATDQEQPCTKSFG